MKRFIILLTLGLVACTISLKGEDSVPDKIVILHNSNNSNKPKAPSKIKIVCYIQQNSIYFDFPKEIDIIEVKIEQDGLDILNSIITHEEPTIQIPTFFDEYKLSCILVDGTEYYTTVYP